MSISNQREFFKELKLHPDWFYIIHYSSQSLYDDNEALSPRVTSIAVIHYATDQTVSFSTHSIAEEMGIVRADVQNRFDDIERQLLQKFFEFVSDRRDKYWVHWNMRNITFGFELIEHRYRTLAHAEPASIPVERRINLNDMLSERYGNDYAPNPKMLNLMELNGGRHRHFKTGEEEVEAFKAGEFIRMHQSTLCKVGFFRMVLLMTITGKLRTKAKGFLHMADRVFESRWARAVGLVSSAGGVGTLLYKIGVVLLP